MGQMLVGTAVALLIVPAAAFAQGWSEYVDRTDRFSVNFPGQPQIRETTYQPQRGPLLKARIYSVQDGPRLYSLTVVNLVELTEPSDVRSAVAWEAWNFRKRGGVVTYDAFSQVDRIGGHQLQITNSDKSQTIVGIYLHARRLYILEATVPPGTPGAVHFQQSLIILDEAGVRVRYELDADGNQTGQVTDFTGIC